LTIAARCNVMRRSSSPAPAMAHFTFDASLAARFSISGPIFSPKALHHLLARRIVGRRHERMRRRAGMRDAAPGLEMRRRAELDQVRIVGRPAGAEFGRHFWKPELGPTWNVGLSFDVRGFCRITSEAASAPVDSLSGNAFTLAFACLQRRLQGEARGGAERHRDLVGQLAQRRRHLLVAGDRHQADRPTTMIE
jgi:hypothetical protein